MKYKCKSCGHTFTANYMTRCPACKGTFITRHFSEQATPKPSYTPVTAGEVAAFPSFTPAPDIVEQEDPPAFDAGGGDSGGGGASGDF